MARIIITLLLLSMGQHLHSAPLIFAHRASSGLWIQNSANAVEQTVALYLQNQQVFDGIEVDIVLTQDDIPVLSHDPWVHLRLCERKDQAKHTKVLIKDLSYTALNQQYWCGGIADTDFPEAATRQQGIMGFEAFLRVLKRAPTLAVYLDVKVQEPLTASVERYAAAIFEHWQRLGMENPLYIEGPNKQAIAAYQRHATVDFTSVLSYPPFWADKNPIKTGIMAAMLAYIKPHSAKKRGQDAKADAIAAPTVVANKRLRKSLKAAGLQLAVFTPNDKKAMQRACSQQVAIIISDHPNLGPCR